MEVPTGATPFITNNTRPNGGVVVAISIFMSIMVANHSGSNPRLLIMGIYIGSVTIIIVSGSIKVPKRMRRICITMRRAIEGIGSPPADSINPELAPVKAKICEKAIAPVKIINIITVIFSVPEIDSFTTFQFHPLYKKARMKHPTAPRAAD